MPHNGIRPYPAVHTWRGLGVAHRTPARAVRVWGGLMSVMCEMYMQDICVVGCTHVWLALAPLSPRARTDCASVCVHDLCTISARSLHRTHKKHFSQKTLLIFLFTTLCGTAPVLAFRAKSYLDRRFASGLPPPLSAQRGAAGLFRLGPRRFASGVARPVHGLGRLVGAHRYATACGRKGDLLAACRSVSVIDLLR